MTNSRLVVPAQPVDATPSNALIRQCFPGRSDLFGCPRSKPSQGSVPADLTLASDLAFVFNASRVRLECCVDPLRPPGLPDKWFSVDSTCPVSALIRTCTILDRHDLHWKIVCKWAQGCLTSPRVGRYAAGPETTTHSQTISRASLLPA